MILFDSHCHLNFKDFDQDLDSLIKESREIGIFLNIVGSDFESSKKAVEITQKYRGGIFASVGIHPTDNPNINDLEKIEKLATNEKVVAIGECGLDYHHFKKDLDKNFQKKLFLNQLELAAKVNKPVIIHCRDAHQDMIDILKQYRNLKLVLHCFTGSLKEAEQYLKLNCFFSFTGIITFTTQYDNVIKNIPLEKIMIETDAPFLAPEPFRGQRNKPIYVKYVASKIAKIKNKTLEEIAKITTENAKSFFNIIDKSLDSF